MPRVNNDQWHTEGPGIGIHNVAGCAQDMLRTVGLGTMPNILQQRRQPMDVPTFTVCTTWLWVKTL